jgi:hypothetical protein
MIWAKGPILLVPRLLLGSLHFGSSCFLPNFSFAELPASAKTGFAMPHLFTNRKRRFFLKSAAAHAHLHFQWESINAIIYCLGGLVFIAGSVLFLPHFDKISQWGAWAFIGGSILYLVVTLHDLMESIFYFKSHHQEDIPHVMEFLAGLIYVTGTVLFIVGSVLFLPSYELTTSASWCFIIGSMLFMIGACINVIQIVQAPTLLTLQLLNATALCFIVGSVLFLAASIPYLWPVANANDRLRLFTYMGWEYVIGSILFFAGGLINYYRAFKVVRHHQEHS